MVKKLRLSADIFDRFASAVRDTEPVSGLTHSFYRYPARFSPTFAREAILAFSQPGDLVLDPFMGGGTTLVEALAAGRNSIGIDISPLASFVAKVKTTILGSASLKTISNWAENAVEGTRTGCKNPPSFWSDAGYQKDIPWPIKQTIENILDSMSDLPQEKQRAFVQCAILRTAQWAIDCKDVTPSAAEFRSRLQSNIHQAIKNMEEFRLQLRNDSKQERTECICLNRSTVGLENAEEAKLLSSKPRLIVTSPPYPGVHVIYHQWQVHSRRRTPAPFWIIGSIDGHGGSHYTFGDYRRSLAQYFETALHAFSSIRAVMDDKAIIVQLVGFSDPKKHLSKYLNIMREAGFTEVALEQTINGDTRRLWRGVPNRKWYADAKGDVSSSREVVLIHRPA